MRTKNAGPLLRRAIELSGRLETLVADRRSRRALLIVGYGSLVRARQLATAIQRLNAPCAYDARVLLRSMLEIKINYAWIRLKDTHSRSLRFVKYLPLERLKLADRLAADLTHEDLATLRRRYISQRRTVRHLFQYRDKKNALRWASTWASIPTVAGRLSEVMEKEKPGSPDLFLYTVYSDLSGTVHGSPGSFHELFEVDAARCLVPKKQPEHADTRRHLFGALILLPWFIDALATDARLRKALGQEWRDVQVAVKEFSRIRFARARAGTEALGSVNP